LLKIFGFQIWNFGQINGERGRNFRRHPQFTGGRPGVYTGPSFRNPRSSARPRQWLREGRGFVRTYQRAP